MFQPLRGHHQADKQNILIKYTHRIMEQRSHFSLIMLQSSSYTVSSELKFCGNKIKIRKLN